MDQDSDTPYNLFSLKDLFYSGLLDYQGINYLEPLPLDVSVDLPIEQQRAKRECELLLANFNNAGSSGTCSWTYNCTQRSDMFPSFYVEAVLTEESEGLCQPNRISKKRFARTTCEQDPEQPHWLECDCDYIVGFESN